MASIEDREKGGVPWVKAFLDCMGLHRAHPKGGLYMV
jgi:hypothetical protein